MNVCFHSHALERMEERGATEAEVKRTIEQGRLSPARFGRVRYSLTFRFQGRWQGAFYEQKLVDVYCVVEGSDRIVVTVVVKYFEEPCHGHQI